MRGFFRLAARLGFFVGFTNGGVSLGSEGWFSLVYYEVLVCIVDASESLLSGDTKVTKRSPTLMRRSACC